MKTSLWPVAACAVVAAGLLQPAPAQAAAHGVVAREVGLAATVLTFEGGLAGIQPFLHFTPLQLGGSLCAAPSTCRPVNYPAWPLGQYFNNQGADRLQAALEEVAGDVTLFGHSQGGQVIYTALRRWAADPASAPDPGQVSWVSIGNPENVVGGRAPNPVPDYSPYSGIEVIKQYDGWADVPTDKSNVLAAINAALGRSSAHVFGYFNVDLNDPANIRYTPDNPDGSPGNITYVFVPNPMLPLVGATGPLAPLLNPVLDPILRPIVEAAYQRPFDVPAPSSAVAVPAPAAESVGVVADPVAEVQMLNDGDPDQDQKKDQRHHRRAADGGGAERLGVNPVRDKVGASRRAATGQRVNGVKDLRRADHTGH